MRCTPSAAEATTMVPPRSRMPTRIPAAQPMAHGAVVGDPAALVTALTTYKMSAAREEWSPRPPVLVADVPGEVVGTLSMRVGRGPAGAGRVVGPSRSPAR